MSGLDSGRQSMCDERRQFEHAWESTSGPWSDPRRDEFEGAVVLPLVRATLEMANKMDAISAVVARALASL